MPLEQIAERLMLTMEGEKELPPVLEVAFRRVPAARKGWEVMTKVQELPTRGVSLDLVARTLRSRS